MELSPEERQKIYEEEKARREAQQQQKSAQIFRGCLFTLAICAVAIVIGLALLGGYGSEDPAPRNEASVPAKVEDDEDAFIKPGATVQLAVDGNAVPVATESQFYGRMIDRLNAGDSNTLGRMMSAGQMFSVKNGTKALVISPGLFSTEVRILEGAHKGDHGLVKTVWIKKP